MNFDIPDYEIDGELGTGGMASVYRARHTRLQRLVALKVMHPELTLRDSDFSERFLREARIAADLSHPNIVQVYDVNLHGKNHFIAMEFVSGGDLKERLKTPIDRDELVFIVDQITRGLDYAHARGYIHRDIKPANILFRDSGEALVSDFGIARAIDSDTHLTKTGSVIGTPTYMSPEQASGATVDGRTDLYSVAVIIYEILTGTVPYVGETSLSIAIKHIGDPIPTLPKPLRAIQPFINRGLAKDPEDRFSSGAELLETLQDGLDQLTADDVQQTTTLLIMRPGEKSKRAGQVTAVRRKKIVNTNENKTLVRRLDKLKPHLPKIGVALGVAVILIIAALSWINAQQISKNQQIQIDKLLSSAQMDVDAGRIYQPEKNNAFEKYRTAKAISDDYPPTIAAIDNISALLMQKSETALLRNEWNTSEEYAQKVLTLSPDNTAALEQIQIIQKLREQRQQELQNQLNAAKQAVESEQWQQSIELYTNLQKSADGKLSLDDDITLLATKLVNKSKIETTSKRFEQATALLTYANKAASLVDNTSLKATAASATANNKQQQSTLNRQKTIQRLLSQAKSTKSADQSSKYYLQVLKLDRNNSTAKNGLKKNTDLLLRDAENAINARKLSSANSALNRISSSPITLSSTQRNKFDELQTLLTATSAQEADLAKLFDRFERYMQAPKVTSAEKIFRRIEAINYTHPRLPALRKELADGYLVLAQRELNAEDWDDAVAWSRKGLVHAADHPQLKKIFAEASEKDKSGDKKLLNFFR